MKVVSLEQLAGENMDELLQKIGTGLSIHMSSWNIQAARCLPCSYCSQPEPLLVHFVNKKAKQISTEAAKKKPIVYRNITRSSDFNL